MQCNRVVILSYKEATKTALLSVTNAVMHCSPLSCLRSTSSSRLLREGVDGRWTIANTPRSVSLTDNLRRGFMGD